jgi:hypothetical protein
MLKSPVPLIWCCVVAYGREVQRDAVGRLFEEPVVLLKHSGVDVDHIGEHSAVGEGVSRGEVGRVLNGAVGGRRELPLDRQGVAADVEPVVRLQQSTGTNDAHEVPRAVRRQVLVAPGLEEADRGVLIRGPAASGPDARVSSGAESHRRVRPVAVGRAAADEHLREASRVLDVLDKRARRP